MSTVDGLHQEKKGAEGWWVWHQEFAVSRQQFTHDDARASVGLHGTFWKFNTPAVQREPPMSQMIACEFPPPLLAAPPH